MLIDCPSCARSYHVSRAAIGAEGRMVVCPLCEARWFVAAPEAVAVDEDAIAASEPEGTGAEAAEWSVEGPDLMATRDDEAAFGPAPGGQRIAAFLGEGRLNFPDFRRWASARRQRPAKAPRRIGAAPRKRGLREIAACAACLLLAMGLIGKRTGIVRAMPRTAALFGAIGLPVNVRGLEFRDVRTARADDGGKGVEISGVIHNIGHARKPVPRIAFEIRDATGTPLASWSENAPKRMLAADETIPFVTQAPALPDGTRDVSVHFSDDAPHPPSLLATLARTP